MITVSTTQLEGTVSCARISITDKQVQIFQPLMFANPATVMQQAPKIRASCVIILEASVIVRDMCLADNAISARKDSTICNSQTLMAAIPVTVIPLGQSMEILPVTKIQDSASAKQMLLVLGVIVAILDLKLSDILMKMDVNLVGATATAQ